MSANLAELQNDMRPPAVVDRDISPETWNALTTSLYPGAQEQSVLMAYDYCKARKLDPLKKPVHIVPMQIATSKKDANGFPIKEWRDVIMPGISEIRTTAARTGEYAGQDEPKFGTPINYLGVEAPESCTVTVYRMVKGNRVGFTHTEWFSEAVAIKKGWNGAKDTVNSMWTKRPRGQLAKCAEAGALRKAFPEEIGNEYAAEEMHGKTLDMGHVDIVEESDGIDMPRAIDEPVIEGEVIPAAEPPQGKPAPEGAIRMVRKQLDAKGISAEDACKHFQVADLTKLTTPQVNDALKWIREHG